MKNPDSGKGTNGLVSRESGGEYRTGPIAGTAIVSGITFGQKGLQYAEVGGLAIFEGDIVLGQVSQLKAAAEAEGGDLRQSSCGITGQQARWPDATVPYDIDASFPNQQRITDAIAHWEANTRIRFVLRTAANQAQYPDYLHFIPDPSGCWSYVGKQGNRQDLGIASWGTTGNVVHEMGHTIGLWHEQSREDRDTFVRIQWANIDPNAQHNFNQHIADGDDLGPYDYGSIMHYSGSGFSINGQPTIVPLQPLPAGVVMGQRNGLSQGDIDGVHTMYPLPVKKPALDTLKEVRKDPVRDTIKEVRKDPIRDTVKEVNKDPILDHPTKKELAKDPIFDRPTIKEISRDPIEPIKPINPYDYSTHASALPFVTGAPSRAPQAVSDPIEEANAYVQELAEALVAIEQEQKELLAAYDEAVQTLTVLVQGR
jgi:hypothetical protein